MNSPIHTKNAVETMAVGPPLADHDPKQIMITLPSTQAWMSHRGSRSP